MAYITGQTTQGCCIDVRYENGIYHCAPDVMPFLYDVKATNTWTCFYAKAVGAVGEDVRVHLHWPAYTPAGVPAGAADWQSKDIAWDDEFTYFLYPARDIVFYSHDRITWKHIGDVTIEGTTLCFTVPMIAETVYFSVCLYYTPQRYRDLLSYVEGCEWIGRQEIGRDIDGDAIFAFRATDDSVPEADKAHIYLQAAQHCPEHMGIYVCDGMLRWFADGSDEARRLLGRYVFHIVPVVSVSCWRLGLFIHKHHSGLYVENETVNPARDWIDMALPSTKAVHRYLQALPKAPVLLLDIHSGITNYKNKRICQSMTINQNLPPEKVEAMKRFIYTVADTCDYLPGHQYWEGIDDDRLFERYAQRLYGQAHTVEISQFAIYDRALGTHVPQDQDGLLRVGPQLPSAMDIFLTGEKNR